MALDPNIGRIKFLRTKTIGRKPSTNDIDEGELALNLVDRTIYTRNGNNIVDIGFGLGGQVNGNITTSGTVKATKLEGPLTGNADSATKLQTARTINGVSFDGTSNITIADSNKLPLTGGTLTGDLTATNLTATGSIKATTCGVTGIGNYSPTGQGAYLSWNRTVGLGKTDFINHKGGGSGGFDWWNGNESGYTQVMSLDQNGVLNAIGGFSGNAATATKLQTARTINGVSFDGSSNITVADSTKLPLTGGTMTGQITTKATSTATGVTGLGTGSTAPIKVPAWNVGTTYGFAPFLHGSAHSSAGYLTQVSFGAYKPESTWANSGAYIAVGGSDANPTEAFLFQYGRKISSSAGAISLVGNADTATKLQTSRTINGVAFDGTANITVADSTKLPLTGGTISGQLVAPNIMINHSGTTASGISWYSSSYNSWQDYMAQAGSTGNGVYGNITAPTGTYVTTWARRSVIEPAAGYGWTFETMTMNGTAPSIVAELSINGTFKTAGDIHGTNLTVSGSINATQFRSSAPYEFLTPQGQEQTVLTGGLLASNAYVDRNKLHQWGIWTKGVIESAAGFKGKLLATDLRALKPLNTETKGISAYFVTEWGLNNDYTGGNYGDFLSLNTYHDASAGMQNGLFFDKTGKRIVHYQSAFGGANWGGGKTLAYAEDVLSINGGTMNAPINFNLSHAEGAFHKLIEGSTTTDGGYIAVGNHGSDRGYVEIGTIDDLDAAIYARKRNAANTIIDEAVILGPDGNTSFPNSVFIRNTPGGYGKNGLVAGNGDNAAYGACNIDITSWFGVGIKASSSGERTVVFNSRNGDISTRGSISADWIVQANRGLGINNTTGAGHGLSLYGGAADGLPSYGISFALTSNFGTHGHVWSDWATYFTMTGGANRGWIFRSHDYGNVASISAQGNAQFNGNIVAGGNITAFSDARLKDNITKIPDALNKLNQLKGVTYTRKDLATNQQYAGLIAQDVQKALPEAVAITEGDTLAVDYNGVIGLLVEAIKELNNRIDKLERI